VDYGPTEEGSQGISNVLWNPEAYYHDRKGWPQVLVLSQMNLVHTLTSRFSMIQFNP